MKPNLIILVREIWRGKSLPRTFLNYSLSGIVLEGEVLDLGSKSSAMSYNRFLKRAKGSKVTYTDLEASGNDVIKIDLENKIKIENEIYDTITCFNTLEHIYNYEQAVNEAYRILKPGGVFVGGTPFLVGYHPDPHDYFRYTSEALEKIFTKAGFKKEKIVSLGMGPFVAGVAQDLHVWPRVLRPFVALISVGLDTIILKIKKNQRDKYPLGFVFVFIKQ
jgi:SAM-dependent methyltransferase